MRDATNPAARPRHRPSGCRGEKAERVTRFDEPRRLNENRKVGHCGPVAQLGARFHGMEEVIGSIPIRSTNKLNNLADSQKKRDTLSIRWFSCCILRSTFYDIP